MYPAAIDIVLKAGACRGAFKVTGADILPLNAQSADAKAEAARTRDLWARLHPYLPASGLLVAKRDEHLSIVSNKGGIIIETSGPVNIGILKAALQNEDVVVPDATASAQDLAPAHRALWSLARWIEGIETPRRMIVSAGSETFEVVGRKGRFAMTQGGDLDTLRAACAAAEQEGSPVTLSYAALDTPLPEMSFEPLDLLCLTKGEIWTLCDAGRFVAVPGQSNLDEARNVANLVTPITSWADGQPFEVSYLRDGAAKEIIARAGADQPGQIFVNAKPAQAAAA